MENLFKSSLRTFCIVLSLMLFICVTGNAFVKTAKHNTEQTGKCFKSEKVTVVANVLFKYMVAADFSYRNHYQVYQTFTYLKPVNDPKPDNTNYQLIKQNSLKLQTCNQLSE